MDTKFYKDQLRDAIVMSGKDVDENLKKLDAYPDAKIRAIGKKYMESMFRTQGGKFPFITHVPDIDDPEDNDFTVESSVVEPGVSNDAEETFIDKNLIDEDVE